MLSQFRKHYPEGSLVSELVTIDHGQYIVRVLLQNNGVTLGTGLAADNNIETAEDRARERALKSLELDHKPTEKVEKVIAQSSPSPQETSQPKPNIEVASPPPEKPIEPVTKVTKKEEPKEIEKEIPPSTKTTTETPTKSPKKQVKSTSNAKKTSPVEPEIEEKPLPIPVTPTETKIEETEIKENNIPTPEPIKEPEIEENPPMVEEEELDFSEIIARSNAELKRLKWTTEQGREYLIKTYGKRSRQVLSDEELLEFLRYLESLPTPA
ncbi:hypothetical protein [Crocosphaera chwakensis]|uniref:Uncharacterized protein n=1 Tax=Crocosphaera chwakensis CCY0110 TaxID=391612 RepID=A3IPZ2_9CHRO|nr:hypothetical protein [Crocosphaera chwakensis]EAZ91332.1 hypothetical protein CY0110_05162 [Crocosphaera chwakensis CCY0110]